jgi:uncharacterized protein (TIGR03083 family)
MFDLNRVRVSWQRECAAIDALVQPLNDRAAQQPIRDDGWTTQDIVGHVANVARAFVHQLQSGAAPPAVTSLDVDALNHHQRERNRTRPWPDVLDYWQRTRDEVTAFLDASSADIGERPAHLPWLPQVHTASDVLRALILHTRSHRQELEQGSQKIGRLERSNV